MSAGTMVTAIGIIMLIAACYLIGWLLSKYGKVIEASFDKPWYIQVTTQLVMLAIFILVLIGIPGVAATLAGHLLGVGK